jgi:cytochrome c oxidase cbb3-type subunit 3/ubiquinol-cytochrome c reductase cytochrome c subunit
LDFATLYGQNCAACHGENGKNGLAISLANPVYLAIAGEAKLRELTANGVPNSLMPPFAKSAGGSLTDQQVDILVQGMLHDWSRANMLPDSLPAYASSAPGDSAKGQEAYARFCSQCHGKNLVDPSYLALVSDQGLRSTILAGWPDQGMPDWRSDGISDQQVTDVVAWLASQRSH